MTSLLGLVGDVGGTNARLALVARDGSLGEVRRYACARFASLEDIILRFAQDLGHGLPSHAVIAVAGPVSKGVCHFTNLGWRVSEPGLSRALGMEEVHLLNDFAAQALAVPRLGAGDVVRVGASVSGESAAPIALLGPGTGLGTASLIRQGDLEIAVPGEGGHAAFAPSDEVEIAIWRRLSAEHGRVSVERLLSGPGLFEIYRSLCMLRDATEAVDHETGLIAAAQAGDGIAAEALDRFCAILGAVAGDLVLSLGAQGGVYVTGGIAPRLLPRLEASPFRERFCAKGRLRSYMEAVPSYVITRPDPGLVGCAHELRRRRSRR